MSRKRAEAEARNARHRETRGARAELDRTQTELAAVESELADLTGRLGDPATYTDSALVRRLIDAHNAALDRSTALTADRDRLTAELATAEPAG
jgi:hypothetical protein